MAGRCPALSVACRSAAATPAASRMASTARGCSVSYAWIWCVLGRSVPALVPQPRWSACCCTQRARPSA
eukprot:2997593-Lingulodinium_polyedra.AAC.1